MNHKNGLALIEVLVVIGILGILSLSVYTVFKSGFDAWSKSETRLDIYQNARVILDQISRELPGAVVGDGAQFEGINVDPDTPDTLEFVTNYGESLYQIKYWVDTTKNILMRSYDENPDYTAISYTNIKFGFMVSDIDFWYLPVGSAGGWGSSDEKEEWTGADADTLPAAVKIRIELQDLKGDTFPFETAVSLPGQ